MADRPPDELTGLGDGCLARHSIRCRPCGRRLQPGDPVFCNDGYDRIYGEFVLSQRDGLHEDNWPSAHLGCAVGAEKRRDHSSRLPRAVVLLSAVAAARRRRRRNAVLISALVHAVAAGALVGIAPWAAVIAAGVGMVTALALSVGLAERSVPPVVAESIAGDPPG